MGQSAANLGQSAKIYLHSMTLSYHLKGNEKNNVLMQSMVQYIIGRNYEIKFSKW